MRYLDAILHRHEELLLIVAFIIAVVFFTMSLGHRSLRPASADFWDYQNAEVCQRKV